MDLDWWCSVSHPKRVIYLTTTLGFGGTERNLVQFCESLDPAKWKIEVWYLHETAESMRERLAACGVEVRYLEAPRSFRPGFLFKLARRLSRVDADLIHVFLPTVAYYAVASKLLFRSRIPMIYSSGGVQFLLPFQRQMMRYGLARYCKFIICNSKAVVRFWEAMRLDSRRIRLVYNGHDLARYRKPFDRDTFRAYLGIAEDEFVICTVGRLIESKRHIDLLEALTAGELENKQIRLLIVGDGPYREELERVATRLAASHRVEFLGQRNDVHSLLRCSDLFAFPSASEGLPNAVIEAALSELPIIASNIPPVTEIVDNGSSARLFSVGDVNEIVRLIGESIENRAQTLVMAQKARDSAEGKFDLRHALQSLEAVYEDAMAGSTQ